MGGGWLTYQESTLAALLPLDLLLAAYVGVGGGLAIGEIMFCGTIPTAIHLMSTPEFAFECHDPVLGRTIGHSYMVRPF